MNKLKILAPTRYPWTFNGPRQSRHAIHRRSFIPFNKISQKIEGITVFNPFPPTMFDLIHAFNRIPLGITPYIIGYESHLPRAFGMEATAYYKGLAHSLAGERCRGIYAISDYARRHFIRQHQEKPWFADLEKKLHVRYPNMPIDGGDDVFQGESDDKINLIFIGNHFARKGGTAVLRLARLAQEQNIPLHIDIISSLGMGALSWVDPLKQGYFNRDRELLTQLRNITVHGSLPNPQVLALLKKSHFSLLPTLSDSFGFSAIESMANYVPMIATAQGALPEFITDGENGFLLPLQTDAIGEWVHIASNNRHSDAYAALFDAEIDRLALGMLERIMKVQIRSDAYKALRKNAYTTAKKMFCSLDANSFWDGVYSEVAG
jgi:glycosyltransferase involved in cell wall biosynthesis